MEWLKTLSILLPILVVLSGAGFYVFNWFIEPDFDNGEYYTTAWIEYGLNQNTLNIEYVPDSKGAVLPAIGEAVKRVYMKAGINSKIDGKPILVKLWVRYKTDLVEIVRFSITAKEVQILEYGTPEERQALLLTIGDRCDVPYNKSLVMIQRDGKIMYINATEVIKPAKDILSGYLTYHNDEVGYA